MKTAVSFPSLWITLILLSGISGYGFWSESLFEQETWSPVGLDRLAQVGTVYMLAAVAVYFWKPFFATPLFLLLAALHCFAGVGPLAPLCVLFFLCSSFLLGRLLFPADDVIDHLLTLLLGIAIWILFIGTAAHFPVNTPYTYLAAFSIPFVVGRRFIRPSLDMVLSWFRPQPVSLSSYTALVLLLFVVLIQYLAALKPEIGHDGLAMHMVITSRLAAHSVWPFDVQEFVWAVMPMGGDWAFSGVYMVGGEYAAHLLNFSFFLMTAGLVFLASRRWLTLAAALLMTALFATTPLVQLVTGSLFCRERLGSVRYGGSAVALEIPRHPPLSLLRPHRSLPGLLDASQIRVLGSAARHPLPRALGVETRRTRRPRVGGHSGHDVGAVHHVRGSSLLDSLCEDR